MQYDPIPVERGAEEVDDSLLLHLLLDLGVLGEVQQQVERHPQRLLLADQIKEAFGITNLWCAMIHVQVE